MYAEPQLWKIKVKISIKYKDLAQFNNEPWNNSNVHVQIVNFSSTMGSVTRQGQKDEQFAANVSFFLWGLRIYFLTQSSLKYDGVGYQ